MKIQNDLYFRETDTLKKIEEAMLERTENAECRCDLIHNKLVKMPSEIAAAKDESFSFDPKMYIYEYLGRPKNTLDFADALKEHFGHDIVFLSGSRYAGHGPLRKSRFRRIDDSFDRGDEIAADDMRAFVSAFRSFEDIDVDRACEKHEDEAFWRDLPSFEECGRILMDRYLKYGAYGYDEWALEYWGTTSESTPVASLQFDEPEDSDVQDDEDMSSDFLYLLSWESVNAPSFRIVEALSQIVCDPFLYAAGELIEGHKGETVSDFNNYLEISYMDKKPQMVARLRRDGTRTLKMRVPYFLSYPWKPIFLSFLTDCSAGFRMSSAVSVRISESLSESEPFLTSLEPCAIRACSMILRTYRPFPNSFCSFATPNIVSSLSTASSLILIPFLSTMSFAISQSSGTL